MVESFQPLSHPETPPPPLVRGRPRRRGIAFTSTFEVLSDAGLGLEQREGRSSAVRWLLRPLVAPSLPPFQGTCASGNGEFLSVETAGQGRMSVMLVQRRELMKALVL